jgi:hypothetical protein
MTDFIHHYTDLNTLALILKHNTIRFNRLDRVDDVSEGSSFSKVDLSQFFFISCWTHALNESIPQWNMYTKEMAGVRIGLPRKMFKSHLLKPADSKNVSQQGKIFSPIPFEKMFGEQYMILPNMMNEKDFCRAVEYDEDYVELKNNSIKANLSDSGNFDFSMQDPTRAACLKSPDWKFQEEYRFVLLILPSSDKIPNNPFDPRFADIMPSFIAQKLCLGEGSDLSYFDIELNPEILKELVVTTGPKCSEGDKILVEALVNLYTPKATIQPSKFEGTIRNSLK